MNANSSKEGFPGSSKTTIVRLVHASERALKLNQHTAEEVIMNIEALELNAVAEVAKAEESVELLALTVDDLDLIGGGVYVGNNL